MRRSRYVVRLVRFLAVALLRFLLAFFSISFCGGGGGGVRFSVGDPSTGSFLLGSLMRRALAPTKPALMMWGCLSSRVLVVFKGEQRDTTPKRLASTKKKMTPPCPTVLLNRVNGNGVAHQVALRHAHWRASAGLLREPHGAKHLTCAR